MSKRKQERISKQELLPEVPSDEEEISSNTANSGGVIAESDDDDINEEVVDSSSSEDEEISNNSNWDFKPTEFPTDSESEDEWDNPNKNTVGNIPMEFYDEYDHIGYNLEGKKIAKPTDGQRDNVDWFLEKHDDPNFWRTVWDNINQRNVVISKADYELITTLMKGKLPDQYDPFEPFVETDFAEKDFPLVERPPSKSDFVPRYLKWEMPKVRRLVRALRAGWISVKPDLETQLKLKREESEDDTKNRFYMMWDDNEESKQRSNVLHAPKEKLPGHIESYNPPAEYLFTEDEKEKWENTEPHQRKISFVPQKFEHLREVPLYADYARERFVRCLDLSVAPRAEAKKHKGPMISDPNELLPKLPNIQDLKPFPSIQSIVYLGHQDKVRTISVDPAGQWLLSGSDDMTVKLWEVETGRCMKTWMFDNIIYTVAWNPNPEMPIVAIATAEHVYILNPETGSEEQLHNIQELFSSKRNGPEDTFPKWTYEKLDDGNMDKIKITHEKPVRQISWHSKGDYLCIVSPDAAQKNVIIVHQISTHKSQSPFTKQLQKVTCAYFHPTRPHLLVATKIHVKIYNLAKLQLEKKLYPNVTHISSIDVHPAGDNVILGSYDCRLSWFDLDLSTKPYKSFRFAQSAIRKVAYHKKYPLFACCGDDAKVQLFHGMVYNDLLQNPFIVPLKQLRGHKVEDGLGILDCVWHPTQPWIFSSGADKSIRLFV